MAQQVIGERPDRLDPAKDKELAKDWGQYYFHLALTYDANANRAEAVKAFQQAVRLGFGETDVAALERAKWQQLIASTGS